MASCLEERYYNDESRLRSAFALLDPHHTGFITLSSLADVIGREFDQATALAMIDAIDLSGDHQISYDEFLIMMRTEGEDSPRPGSPEAGTGVDGAAAAGAVAAGAALPRAASMASFKSRLTQLNTQSGGGGEGEGGDGSPGMAALRRADTAPRSSFKTRVKQLGEVRDGANSPFQILGRTSMRLLEERGESPVAG